MGRKKGGRGKKGRVDEDWSDEEPKAAAPAPKEEEAAGQPQQSRKAKRAAKQQAKQQQHKKQDSDDDDDDDIALLLGGGGAGKNKKAALDSDSDSDDDDMMLPPQPAKKGGRGGRQQPKKPTAAALISGDDDSDDSDDESEEDIPQPAKTGKNKKNKGKGGGNTFALDDDDSEGDVEALDDNEDEDEDDGDVEQITFKILDEPKKKKKKEKKEKKKKKDKNGGGDVHAGSDDETSPKEETKSKFQLQMEAAMKKKEDAGEEDMKPAPSEDNKDKGKKGPQQQVIPETPDELAGEEMNVAGGEDEELMYGHPDDVVWSDKSHAIKEAEANAGESDEIPTHGKDGKKLSNKERKRLQKEKEARERMEEYEKVAAKNSREGAQFACSQTAVNEKDPQWENSLDINIPNFSISAAGKILFKDASLTIAHGRRYGLVGPNGRGKSTLLKMIASKDLKLPPRIDFLYVEQEVVADNTPAVEAVLRADKVRWDLMEEEKALMAKVDAGDESMEVIERLGVVVEELTNMGADAMEAKARRILYGLGFSMEMQTKPTKMFSGGWRMRISLARALFVEPTLLMLDEPTNHLDLNAVIWLDQYLQTWKKTLFVVSHDQDFLNSVCQEILNIEDLKLISYKGDYDTFKKSEADRHKQLLKAWEKQEKRLRELKKGGQSKAKAQQTVMKNQKREAGARSQKKKNQAIAAGTETAENSELIKRPKEYTVRLDFTEIPELSRPVMEVTNVHFRYSPKHPVIFDNVDFGIDMDSRICVVGPNGAGKSTLLKLLTGEVEATKGDVRRNPRLRMGIYNQHFVDRLPMNKTPVEHLRDRYEDLDYQTCRNRLGKYGLEGHAHEVVMRDLSGGQKARVVFVDLSLQMPHILLLDEPTNNLDVETIDALIDAMQRFNGGIVVVTHDQRLIEECDCTLWVVEKQGVTQWDAGFDDYKDNILEQLEAEVEREAQVRRQKLETAAAAKAEKLARLAKKVKK